MRYLPSRGYTLLEVLVALALVTIGMLLYFQVYMATGAIAGHHARALQAQQQLIIHAEELRSEFVVPNDSIWEEEHNGVRWRYRLNVADSNDLDEAARTMQWSVRRRLQEQMRPAAMHLQLWQLGPSNDEIIPPGRPAQIWFHHRGAMR